MLLLIYSYSAYKITLIASKDNVDSKADMTLICVRSTDILTGHNDARESCSFIYYAVLTVILYYWLYWTFWCSGCFGVRHVIRHGATNPNETFQYIGKSSYSQ